MARRGPIPSSAARLALILALCAAPAFAQPGPKPGDEGGPGGHWIERLFDRNAERLHLDDATRARIRALAEAGRKETEPQREVLRRLHEQMHALLSADAPELAAVLSKADEIGQAETALQKQRLRTMLSIRALLTPEQRRELVRIHEEFRAQHPEWGRCEPGMEHGPGCWRGHAEPE